MSRTSLASRLALAGALLALAVPVAATAQSDEVVPTTEEYAAAYQRGCTDLATATTRFSRKYGRINRTTKTDRGRVRRARRILYPYLSDIQKVADRFAAALPTPQFESFQRAQLARSAKLGPQLRVLKRAGRRARTVRSFNRVVRRIDRVDLGGGEGLPDELVQLAPACRPFA